jgi:hypothetical protein
MRAIGVKHTLSSEKHNQLKRAADVQVGMEIVHLFVMELLGYGSAAAQIFNTMARAEYVHIHVIHGVMTLLAFRMKQRERLIDITDVCYVCMCMCCSFRHSIVVTKTAKRLAWAVLFVLNFCFVFFSVTR